nr:unnamed protein product [Callosobruchus analis]
MADLFGKVTTTCTYCQEEINGLRIQCCVCPDFDICIQCFSVGAEIGPHKSDHAYKFVDQCVSSVFGGRGAWTGEEQLLLLNVVGAYGFGNWKLVSQLVETRTPEEVKEEFIARYIDGNIGRAMWAPLANHRPVLVDHVPEDDGPLSPTTTAKLPPLDITLDEARLLGYKPHRDDYEREYNMEAEQLVSKLQWNPDEDTEMEVALKLAIVDMYTRRLKERARRKRTVRDYQLVAKYFANLRKDPSKRPMTKEQRELHEKMRVFSQYMSSGEHERLLASIERERELRYRLNELIRYRSLGLTTQEEIIHYEQHAAYMRQQRKQKTGSSGSAVTDSQSKNGRSVEAGRSSPGGSSTWPAAAGSAQQTQPPARPPSSSSASSSSVSAAPTAAGTPLPEKATDWPDSRPEGDQQPAVEHLFSDKSTSSSSSSSLSLDDSEESNIREAVTQYLSYSGWLPDVSVV